MLLALVLLAGLVPAGPAVAGRSAPPLGRAVVVPAQDEPAPLLPDLQTLPPDDLSISPATGGGRVLRLANLVWNSGAGPLNLVGALVPSTQQTLVVQQLSFPDSEAIEEHVVGEFVYHPLHDHFHIDNFAIYEIWSLTPAGELSRLVAQGGKLSYCLIETDIVDNQHANFTLTREHTECGQEVQGILPGWGDKYKADLPGQTIDISHLPNGRYVLRSTANPDSTILESDYTNNTGAVIIELRNYTVSVLEDSAQRLLVCRDTGHC